MDVDVDDVDVEAPVVGGRRKEAEVKPTRRSEREGETAGEPKRVAENERDGERERLVLSEGVSSG